MKTFILVAILLLSFNAQAEGTADEQKSATCAVAVMLMAAFGENEALNTEVAFLYRNRLPEEMHVYLPPLVDLIGELPLGVIRTISDFCKADLL